MIAQCESVADVKAAIAYAQARRISRSRSAAAATASPARALTDGGLVVDMRKMNAVEVDPAGAHRDRGGRRDLGGLRPRDAAARPDDDGRAGLDDRRRRPDPWRRLDLARAQVRASPATACSSVDLVTADGQRGHGVRGREPGAVLGAARRRRELRRRDEARRSASHAAAGGDARAAVVARGGRARGDARAIATCWTGARPRSSGGGLAYITGPPEDFVPAAACRGS